MPVYYALGTALASRDEYLDQIEGQWLSAVVARKGRVVFETGELRAADLPQGQPVGFSPIGSRLPLTIDIREVYTGRNPHGLFAKQRPMLVTSAIKSYVTFDAAVRAVNILMDGVRQKSHIKRGPATANGTPLVFYSPALLAPSLSLTLEVVFDNFPQEAVDALGNAFTQAGGIPLFLPQSSYLIAAGAITKLVGRAGEALFDGSPSMRATEAIDVELPGRIPATAGYRLVTSEDVDVQFRREHKIVDGQLVDGSGALYAGEIPYVIISLDGHEREDYKDFAPHAASAALLGRFFHLGAGQDTSLQIVLDGLKLASDLKFSAKAKEVKAKLDALPPEDPNRAALQAEYVALVKNLLTDAFKPA